jgi:hypothetical protein
MEQENGWKLRNEHHDSYFAPYYVGHQMKEDKMGGACDRNGGEDKCIHGSGRET